MDTIERTRTVVFTAGDVATIVTAAQATGELVDLVKDDGVYLVTGHHPGPVVVYAVDLDSPTRHETGTVGGFGFDDGWLAQRRRIEDTCGGDDFCHDVDLDALACAAAAGTGVAFDLDVLVHLWAPGTAPRGLSPDVHHLTRLERVGEPRPAG